MAKAKRASTSKAVHAHQSHLGRYGVDSRESEMEEIMAGRREMEDGGRARRHKQAR